MGRGILEENRVTKFIREVGRSFPLRPGRLALLVSRVFLSTVSYLDEV